MSAQLTGWGHRCFLHRWADLSQEPSRGGHCAGAERGFGAYPFRACSFRAVDFLIGPGIVFVVPLNTLFVCCQNSSQLSCLYLPVCPFCFCPVSVLILCRSLLNLSISMCSDDLFLHLDSPWLSDSRSRLLHLLFLFSSLFLRLSELLSYCRLFCSTSLEIIPSSFCFG